MSEETEVLAGVLAAALAERGPDALSQPGLLGNLCADLAPDIPGARHLLVTAAEFDVAKRLTQRSLHGLDTETAVMMVSDELTQQRFLQIDVSRLVVGEFARALGYRAGARTTTDAAPSATGIGQGSPPSVGSQATEPAVGRVARTARKQTPPGQAEEHTLVAATLGAPPLGHKSQTLTVTAPGAATAAAARPSPRRRRVVAGIVLLAVVAGTAVAATLVVTRSGGSTSTGGRRPAAGGSSTTEATIPVPSSTVTDTSSPTVTVQATTTATTPTTSGVAPTTIASEAASTVPVTAAAASGPDTPVPVVACPVEVGVSGGSPAPQVPSTVSVPSAIASQLVGYSDGYVTAVAPAGWSCSGVLAADGGRSLAVTPPGQVSTPPYPSNAQGVSVELPSEGTGVAAYEACPYFPSAAAAFGNCDATAGLVAGEVTYQQNTQIVLYEDPAGVNGQGDNGSISGGLVPANGVVIYQADVDYTAIGNCTLPEADHAVCTVVLNDFINRYQSP